MNFKKIKLGHTEDIIVHGIRGLTPPQLYIKVNLKWDNTKTKILSADVELFNAKFYQLYITDEIPGGHICVDSIHNGLFSHVFEIYLVETSSPQNLKTTITPNKDMMIKSSGSYLFVNIIAHEVEEDIDLCKSYIIEQEFDGQPETIGGAIIVSI